MKNGICPKCNSTEIIPEVDVHELGRGGADTLRVEVVEKEPAKHGFVWSPQIARGEIRAWICSQCGYTELYTNNLAELYKIYRLGR